MLPMALGIGTIGSIGPGVVPSCDPVAPMPPMPSDLEPGIDLPSGAALFLYKSMEQTNGWRPSPP
jgi:hypothetical protein